VKSNFHTPVKEDVKYTADLPFCGNKSQVQPTAATIVEVLEAHA